MNDNDGLTTRENMTLGEDIAADLADLDVVDQMCVLEEIAAHIVRRAVAGSEHTAEQMTMRFASGVLTKVAKPRFAPNQRKIDLRNAYVEYAPNNGLARWQMAHELSRRCLGR